jgi:hypothetical protein
MMSPCAPAVRIRAPQARALGARAGPDPGDDDAVDARRRRRRVIGRNNADARSGYPPAWPLVVGSSRLSPLITPVVRD